MLGAHTSQRAGQSGAVRSMAYIYGLSRDVLQLAPEAALRLYNSLGACGAQVPYLQEV